MKDRNDDLLRRARQFFNASSNDAEDIAHDPEEMEGLLRKSRRKMKQVDDGKHNFSNFFSQLGTLQRMLRAYSRGHYRRLPWKSVLSIIGGLLYFLNPFDIIPDFIPGIGLIDDVTLLAWIYKSISADIARFEDWEYDRHMVRR